MNNEMKKLGYSVAEMLAVMAIISVLLVIGLPNMRNYSQQKALDQGVELIKSELQKAKLMATAPDINRPANVVAYWVEFDFSAANKNKINLYESKAFGVGTGGYDNSAKLVESIELPAGVAITDVFILNSNVRYSSVDLANTGVKKTGIQYKVGTGEIKFTKFATTGEGVDYAGTGYYTYNMVLNHRNNGKQKYLGFQTTTGAISAQLSPTPTLTPTIPPTITATPTPTPILEQ